MRGFLGRLAGAVVVIFGLVACDQGTEAPADWLFPAVTLQRMDGGTVEFPETYAGKVVIFNIWATWCPPCRAEMPSLQRLADQLDPQRFVVVTLAVDREPALAKEYFRQTGFRFDSYVDPKQLVSQGVLGVETLPHTFLIDGRGQIRSRHEGMREWDLPDAVSEVRGLAAQGVGS